MPLFLLSVFVTTKLGVVPFQADYTLGACLENTLYDLLPFI